MKREIREELATEIEVDELLTTVGYDYPKFHLTMHCNLIRKERPALHTYIKLKTNLIAYKLS